MERETGFEPATSTLARSHSTAELFPLTPVVKYGTTRAGAASSHGPHASDGHGPARRRRPLPSSSKGVGDDLDAGGPVTNRDAHDIEATRDAREPTARQIVERHANHALLLPRSHGRQRTAERGVGPGLHLHEHQHAPVFSDDVDFAISRPIPACKDRVPSSSQLPARELLADFS